MSSNHLAKITLNTLRATLKDCKSDIYARLKDPKITDWQQISFEKNGPLLKALGISANAIGKALKSYPATAKELSKKIAHWDNEIGNQLADLLGAQDPALALKKAQALEAEIAELDERKATLQQQLDIFFEIDRHLRQSLSIQALAPIAERSPGVKSNLFKTGLETLSLISNEATNGPKQKSISEIDEEAGKLTVRFTHVDIPVVPRLAEEVIYHHIELGASTIQEITTFIEGLNGRLVSEVSALEQIKIAIGDLYTLDTKAILHGIRVQAAAFGILVNGLYHKRQLKKNIDTIEETLELLNIYHLTLKNKVIPALTEEVGNPASLLNPTTLSVRKTKDFFVGTKGIIRSIKMMVTSLKGHEAINEIELQVILETALQKCAIYYGKSPKDVKKLQEFIHMLIANFLRPFPYDDLFALTKRTIGAYGGQIEHFFKRFIIPSELKSLTTIALPGTFGELYTKLKEKKAAFHKANTGK